ncbi:carbohydrate ABC transporter permease [Peterkaempfera sp. SMS 1(5)a]|uniref:carbohydrate ABC transporter permease n=1 Tax=Peterkaempfera podocarpi TaxID=3232308 RepID=UPI0036713AFF
MPQPLMVRHRTDHRQPRPVRRPGRGRALLNGAAPYLFIAPFLVSFVVFFAAPSVVSIVLSFFQYRGYGSATFSGLHNYDALFQSPDFWQSARVTLFYWLVPLVPLLGGGFLLALLVRSKLAKLPSVFKPLLFIPQVMAPVAAALVWRVILSSNGVLDSLTGLHIDWLNDPQAGKWAVVMLLLWRGVGWYFVIFLAGMTNVPDELLEAAHLDGANAVQRIRHVTIPVMRPIILFAVVIDTISSFQLFTEPNLLVGGSGAAGASIAPPTAAPVMNQVVGNITAGQFGLSAAAGWLLFLAIGIFSVIQFRLLRERGN